MLTSWPNLKKCSMPKFSAFLFLILLLTLTSASAVDLRTAMGADILGRNRNANFSGLIAKWEKRYGVRAAPDLFSIARDRKFRDTDRFIAFMGAAKLAGPDAKTIQPFLSDPSWMLRSAALRTLGGFHQREAGLAVLNLLRDPAQVVQSEAIDTVLKLKPTGAKEALVQMKARNCTEEVTPDCIFRKTLDALTVFQNPDS